MSECKEIWKDIKGFENRYQVSNLARVRSLDRLVKEENRTYKRKGALLKQSINDSGYNVVQLYRGNGGYKNFRVHRLVAIYFIGNKYNKPCVNHINGIKTDNRIENLEWCTYKENIQHAIKTGLNKGPSSENINTCKLSPNEVVLIRKLYKEKNIYTKLHC